MRSQVEEAEIDIYEVQYQSLKKKILRWPKWKILSFCLDQTDLRLLQEILADVPEIQQKSR